MSKEEPIRCTTQVTEIKKQHEKGQVTPLNRINFRVEPELGRIVRKLICNSKADDLSDYVRGLLVEDAIEAGEPLHGISIPGWLTERRISISKKRK